MVTLGLYEAFCVKHSVALLRKLVLGSLRYIMHDYVDSTIYT